MEHKETYRTCDRCGIKLQGDMSKIPLLDKRILKRIKLKKLEIDTKTAEPYSHIINSELHKIDDENSIYDMELYVGYNTKRKRLDLCGECRKDFERFMRNE